MVSSFPAVAALKTSDVVVRRVLSVAPEPEPVPTSGNLGLLNLVPPSGVGGVLMDSSQSDQGRFAPTGAAMCKAD